MKKQYIANITSDTPRRNGIQVYITNSTDTPSGDNCYNVTGSRDGHDIDDITRAPCSGRGRYILLYTTVSNEDNYQPILDFCEVDVNGKQVPHHNKYVD